MTGEILSKLDIKVLLLEKILSEYYIRPSYRTYPYKHAFKQFRSLQITASVLLSTSL